MSDFAARKKMFRDMGDFAKEGQNEQLRAKYGPKEPEVEDVPGTEEDGTMLDEAAMPMGEGSGEEMAEGEPQDIEAILAQMSPEELEALLMQVK